MTAVTILSDNTVAENRRVGLTGEWGFAAAVGDVLLDAGLTGAAHRNAMLIDGEATFDAIVVSHGHQDHTAGLTEFLVDDPTVYLHPEAWRPRYKDGLHIGLPYVREKVANAAEIVEHTEPVEVASGVWALGEIPREHPDNPVGRTPGDGGLVVDHVPDDQSLAVETAGGSGSSSGAATLASGTPSSTPRKSSTPRSGRSSAGPT